MNIAFNILRKLVSLGFIAIILATVIFIFGHKQIGGYDHSTLIDTGWRLFNGQKPYQDFYLTYPVAFYIGAKMAFVIWGVKWSSIIILTAFFSMFTFIAHTLLLNRIISWKFSIFLALICQLFSMVIPSYWWYNSISNISACLFLTSAFVLVLDKKIKMANVYFLLCLILLMFMKPNSAGSIIILVFLALCLKKQRRLSVLILFSAGLLIVSCILLAIRINPIDVVSSYIEIARSRGMPSLSRFWIDKREEVYISIPLLIVFFVPVSVIINEIRRISFKKLWNSDISTLTLLSLGGLISGILVIFTDIESSLVSAPLIFLSGYLMMLIMIEQKTIEDKAGDLAIISIFCCTVSILLGLFIRFFFVTANLGYLLYKTWIFLGVNIWKIMNMLAITGVIASIFVKNLPKNIFFSLTNFSSKIGLKHLFLIVVVICGFLAFYAAKERWRVRMIGPGVFYTTEPLTKLRSPLFFKDFYIAPMAARVVQEIDAILRLYSSDNIDRRGSRIFFGPRIEFAYAAFGVESPRNMPIWWHPGSSFPESKTNDVIEQFRKHSFDICIFLRYPNFGTIDFTRMPQELIQYINSFYARVDYGDISIYMKKSYEGLFSRN